MGAGIATCEFGLDNPVGGEGVGVGVVEHEEA